MLGLFAEKDGVRDAGDRAAGGGGHQEGGQAVEIHIYPGVDHAFFNDENTAAYNKAAADDAWRRTLALFRTNLK